MTRTYRPSALARMMCLLSAVLLLASCLNDNEEVVVYPGDAAITAFSLGDFNRYLTTTSSTGTDSVYKTTVTGSTFKFYIDQVNREIYNADSLPYGTDVAHLLCNVTSKNSGTVVVKNVDSDTLKYLTSTDSIDFTTPRQVSVYSLDGTTNVTYTVTVNVHHEQADEFKWSSMPSNEAFANAQSMRMYACNGRVFALVSDGMLADIYYMDEEGEQGWKPTIPNFNSPILSEDVDNFVAGDSALYLYHEKCLIKSADGSVWKPLAYPAISRLLAADATRLYALDEEGHLVSSTDEGQSWQMEALDADATLLPMEHTAYCRLQSRVNDSTEQVVIAGSRRVADYYDDQNAVVWAKVSEHAQHSRQDAWMYISANDVDTLTLPRLSQLTLTAWNGSILAMGSQGVGASTAKAYTHIYQSTDGGIYWDKSQDVPLPDGFAAAGALAMTTDSHGRLWLVCGGSGQVWRGRMPGADWVQQPKVFTK